MAQLRDTSGAETPSFQMGSSFFNRHHPSAKLKY